ncbi:cation diffusion facilitator family transporter [Sphingomonas jatrophae]|uniref:Cobalt-zinc-cadmium efflux system protein n=1 Tax=Sphingomonas jatrophae TaxID=1166337 RepID=A0A1I6JEI0_9SPHN|nr:cation diffusion facilitator family transporter [Sphingomonas jatrophae]SFR77000.1 cobalt-zinc-cadmium efflux system protein [Sphingomonas jatrophae]
MGDGHHHAHGGGHGHHAHGHGGHGHAHGHGADAHGRAFAVGIALNIAFVVAEAAAGLLANSMALLADAGHNLSDVLGLAVAWGATLLARRPPSARFTYGLRGSSILAALFNGLVLVLACGGIMWEAMRRLGDPPQIAGPLVMVVAAIGIAINLATALMFARGAKGDINLQGAFLHMAADAAVSAGVVAAGALTLWTGAAWIDPVTSLVIVAIILAGTWGLLREATTLALAGVPRAIDPERVEALLARLPGVVRVHHLHIWPLSTTEAALTAHLVMPSGADDGFLHDAAEQLQAKCGIAHATLQVERGSREHHGCGGAAG